MYLLTVLFIYNYINNHNRNLIRHSKRKQNNEKNDRNILSFTKMPEYLTNYLHFFMTAIHNLIMHS